MNRLIQEETTHDQAPRHRQYPQRRSNTTTAKPRRAIHRHSTTRASLSCCLVGHLDRPARNAQRRHLAVRLATDRDCGGVRQRGRDDRRTRRQWVNARSAAVLVVGGVLLYAAAVVAWGSDGYQTWKTLGTVQAVVTVEPGGAGSLVYSWCMSRTNIDIDDDLCQQVMDRYHLATKREAVNMALRHLAGEPLGLTEARALKGSGWDADLDDMRASRV